MGKEPPQSVQDGGPNIAVRTTWKRLLFKLKRTLRKPSNTCEKGALEARMFQKLFLKAHIVRWGPTVELLLYDTPKPCSNNFLGALIIRIGSCRIP